MIRVPAPGETQADRIERMLADIHEALPVIHRVASDMDRERKEQLEAEALDRASIQAGFGRQGGRSRKRRARIKDEPAPRLPQLQALPGGRP